MNGVIVVDKPSGITSRDAVNCVQKNLPRRTKVGHTGTLDPLATGVLVICVGHATRLVEFVQDMPKTYHACIRLGATSSTDDADGDVNESSTREIARDTIEEALPRFLGVIEQIPPAVSALKVDGKRAHELARRGVTVTLAPRRVRVDAVRIASFNWPELELEIDCGKGTYIRSIARDLGHTLGVGGYIKSLRRTRIGPFTTDQAISPNDVLDDISHRFLPPSAIAEGMTRIAIAKDLAKRFREGNAISSSRDFPMNEERQPIAVFDSDSMFVGIGEPRSLNRIQPTVILDRWA